MSAVVSGSMLCGRVGRGCRLLTDMLWRGVIPCVTTAQQNSAAGVFGHPRCTMARPAATQADGKLLDKILSIVRREQLVGGMDESKKTVEFVAPEELKVQLRSMSLLSPFCYHVRLESGPAKVAFKLS